MLEADVSQGKLISSLNSASPILIMAHPPITVSDLSLDDFLDTVLDYHKPKGMKFDVKSIDVLDDFLKAIEKRIDRVIVHVFKIAMSDFKSQFEKLRYEYRYGSMQTFYWVLITQPASLLILMLSFTE